MKTGEHGQDGTMASGRRGALIALYHETWGEINRLRDYEWKIAYYFVSLNVGVIALFLTDAIRGIASREVLWGLTIVEIVFSGLSLFYLHTTHVYLTEQRNVRRFLEDLLGFYDVVPGETRAVLPTEWKGVRITYEFQRTGLLLPLMVTLILAHAFAVYVMWSIYLM